MSLNNLLTNQKAKKAAGDTIVEVMISLTVLAVAMATVYGISTTSLKTSVETKKRTEAVALAQSQVDYLVAAFHATPSRIATYQIATPFCIPSYGAITRNTQAQPLCLSYGGSVYNIGVTYDTNSQIFTVTAQWPSANAPNGIANLNFYYKLPG